MIVMLQKPGQHRADDAYILARGAGNALYEKWPCSPGLQNRLDSRGLGFVRYDGKRITGKATEAEYCAANGTAKALELARLRAVL